MNLRRARAVAGELGQLFHQTAMREATGFVELAYELADSDVEDEAAASRLRAAFSEPKRRARPVAYCLERLSHARETRTGDRAYRIAQGAASGAPVAPVEPARVEIFGRLREMVGMPVGEAYALLAELVPELAPIVDAAEPLPDEELHRFQWSHRQKQRIACVVGPSASHRDPLVMTAAMADLVLSYMHIIAGDDAPGTVDTPQREIVRARLEELGNRESYSVEQMPGGRYRVTATTTFGRSRGSD